MKIYGAKKSKFLTYKNLSMKATKDFELDEPRSDNIKEIATAKVKQAYRNKGYFKINGK